ncbi:MAG: hypothetical protein II452_03645, partial [Paludibacteraceae bacterium]|nr:hypothetical protein [Paludibacteraceae bacterium]
VRPASEIDPLQKLGTQAEEIVDILGELGQAPERAKGKGKKVSEKKAGEKKASGKAKAKAKKAEPVVEAEVVAEPEPIVAPVVEPVVEPIVEPVVEAEPIVIPPIPTPMPEPVIEPSNPEPAPEKPKKEYHFLRDVIICVVILLFLLLGAFFFMRHQLSSWLESMINNDPVQTEVVVETNSEEIASAAEETEVNAEEPSMFDFDNLFSNIEMPDMSVLSSTKERLVSTCEDAYDDIKLWVMNLVQEVTGYFGIDDLGPIGLPSGEEEVIEEVAIEDVEIEEVMPEEITAEAVTPEEVVTEPVVKPAAAVKAVRSSIPSYKSAEYSEWITTEYIAYGSRLAWIAKKYYGDKIYWPYLYDANRDHISNPSNITVGTAIRVPKLSAAQRDTTSAAFKQLREEAYNAVR